MRRSLGILLLALLFLFADLPSAPTEQEIVWLIGVQVPTGHWGNDLVSRAMMKAAGVRVRIIEADVQGQMLNILMTGGNPPEMITLPRDSWQVEQLIHQEKLWDLDELSRKNGYSMDALLGTDIAAGSREISGALFVCPGMVCLDPARAVTDTSRLPCLLLRRDLAGMQMDFSTAEGFLSALGAIKEAGTPIPLGLMPFTNEGCQSIEGYLREALGFSRIQDGRYFDWLSQQETQDWLFALAEANRMKYLDESAFVCSMEEISDKLSRGEYGVFIGDASQVSSALQDAQKAGCGYIAVEGPRNSAGNPPRFSLDCLKYGQYATMISKASANPDAAMKWLAYMLSDQGQRMMEIGVPGSMWSGTGEGILLSDAAVRMFHQNIGQYRTIYGGGKQYSMLTLMDHNDGGDVYALDSLAGIREMLKKYGADETEDRRILLRAQHESLVESYLMKKGWGNILPDLLSAEDRDAFDRTIKAYFIDRQADGYDEFCRAVEEITGQ